MLSAVEEKTVIYACKYVAHLRIADTRTSTREIREREDFAIDAAGSGGLSHARKTRMHPSDFFLHSCLTIHI